MNTTSSKIVISQLITWILCLGLAGLVTTVRAETWQSHFSGVQQQLHTEQGNIPKIGGFNFSNGDLQKSDRADNAKKGSGAAGVACGLSLAAGITMMVIGKIQEKKGKKEVQEGEVEQGIQDQQNGRKTQEKGEKLIKQGIMACALSGLLAKMSGKLREKPDQAQYKSVIDDLKNGGQGNKKGVVDTSGADSNYQGLLGNGVADQPAFVSQLKSYYSSVSGLKGLDGESDPGMLNRVQTLGGFRDLLQGINAGEFVKTNDRGVTDYTAEESSGS